MAKALVTGGAGFVGSNLVERLVGEGYEVSVIDNLNTGSEDNLRNVRGKIRFMKADTSDLEKFETKFDYIFHLGAYSSSPMYKENPYLVAEVIRGFTAVLEHARKNGSRIVYASSSSVYSGLTPPHREDMKLEVTDYYTEGRIAFERLAKLYNILYGVKSVGLRFFSVYGPHEEAKKQYANLVTQFLWAMKKNEEVVVYGDGEQTRDFTYVDDIVEANIRSAKASIPLGVYNVGNGRQYSINEMIQMLEKHSGMKAKVKHIENPIKNYVRQTMADTSKAEKEIGFKARIGLDEGIKRLIEAYK